MTIQLRHYQKKVQLEASKGFANGHDKQIWVMPAGSGKTFTAGDTIRRMVEKGKKVAFFCHKNDLITQSYNSFKQLGLNVGIISSQFAADYDLSCDVQVISIPTLNARAKKILEELFFDYIFFDECHHMGSSTWVKIFEHFTEKGSKVVGLTATPCRLDGKPLGNYFEHMILGPTVLELIEEGSLSKYRYFAPTTIDMSAAKKRGGDYRAEDVKAAIGKAKIMGDIPKAWYEHARGMKTIGFAPNTEQGMQILQECVDAGIRCGWLDANDDEKERRKIIAQFADGEIDILWNINLFSEGFDLSAQVGRDVPIESVLLCRPTQSLSLYIQQVTRALRKKPTTAVVIDFVNNYETHGFPCWNRDWSLDKTVKTKAQENIEEYGVAITRCKKCYRAFEPKHKSCPYCNTEREKTAHEYEMEKKIAIKELEIKEKDEKKEKKKQFAREMAKCKTKSDAIDLYCLFYNKDNRRKAAAHLSFAYKRLWERLQ